MSLRARITRITEIIAGVTLGPITRITAPQDATPGHLVAVDAAGQPVVLVPPPDAPEVLDDLADVDAPSPEDGDVLTYSGSAGAWVAAEGGGGLEPLDPDPSGSYTSANITVDVYGRVTAATSAAPPRIAVPFQWAGDATAGDDEGIRAIHMPGESADEWTPDGWTIEAVAADGTLENVSATFAVSARAAAGGSLTDLVGSGTAPSITNDSRDSGTASDWTGGNVEAGGTLVVAPVSHTPGDAVLLILTLYFVRA